ncbi:hypothetical protein DIPPA_10927 [Diplonema papillatum]|nr:hypothetical protein DIPPA_10927 [Diplonema papillatum]
MGLVCTEVVVHADNPYQVIGGFGATDSAAVGDVGECLEGDLRETVAKLLFSTTRDASGHPEGIGLSAWTYRIGAGSARTDEGPSNRRFDTFLTDDWRSYGLADSRAYDFSRSPGRSWFLHSAVRYGVEQFVAASYAPPYPLAPSGTTQGGDACSLWTEDDTLLAGEYATYLAVVLAHFNTAGVAFNQLCPVRATHSGGGDGEGCRYTNAELLALLQCVDLALTAEGLDCQISGPAPLTIDFLTTVVHGREESSDVIASVFGSRSVVPPARFRTISAASYFSCWPHGDRLVSTRERLAAVLNTLVQQYGISFSVSEYSVTPPYDDPRIPAGMLAETSAEPTDTPGEAGMRRALWAARVISTDLQISGASEWYWGDAASSPGDPPGALLEVADGKAAATKCFWALGHFSLFVRPGMRRVKTTRGDSQVVRDGTRELLACAFMRDSRFVAVFVNNAHAEHRVRLSLKGCPHAFAGLSTFNAYLTSATASLTKYHTSRLSEPFDIPPRSIVTCAGDAVEEGLDYLVCGRDPGAKKPLYLTVSSPAPHTVVGCTGYAEGNPLQLWRVVPLRGEEQDAIGGLLPGEASQAWTLFRLVNTGSGLCVTCEPGASVAKPAAHRRGEQMQRRLPLHQAAPSAALLPFQCWRGHRTASGRLLLAGAATKYVVARYGDTVVHDKRTAKQDQTWSFISLAPSNPALPHRHQPAPSTKPRKQRNILTPRCVEVASHLQPILLEPSTGDLYKKFFAPSPAVLLPGGDDGPPGAGEPPDQQQQQQQHHGRQGVEEAPTERPVQPRNRYGGSGLVGSGEVTARYAVLGEEWGDETGRSGFAGFSQGAQKWDDGGGAADEEPDLTVAFKLSTSHPLALRSPRERTSPQRTRSGGLASPQRPAAAAGISPAASSPRAGTFQAKMAAEASACLPASVRPQPGSINLTSPITLFAGGSAVPQQQGASDVHSSTQGVLDERRQRNEELRAQMAAEAGLKAKKAEEARARREKEIAVKEELERQAAEEAERIKRRGTSHLVLSLAMPRREFDTGFQRTFRSTIARTLKIAEKSVILSLIGADAKGLKLEVRLTGVPDASTRLDELFEAVSTVEAGGGKDNADLGSDESDSSVEDDRQARAAEKSAKRSATSKSSRSKKSSARKSK